MVAAFLDVMLELLPDCMQKTVVHIHICFISSFTVIFRFSDTLFVYLVSFNHSWISMLVTWRLENWVTSREFLLGVLVSHRELEKCSQHNDFAMGCTVQGSDPTKCKRFVSSLKCPDQLWNPSTLFFCGYWEPFSQSQSNWGMSLTTFSI
jgi:hypothetical protein